jgi:glycosyltransferase involved in cell wall biosynthesis
MIIKNGLGKPGMRILYIGYWDYANNLTKAAILPHLRCLGQFKIVEKIIFITIERTQGVNNHSAETAKTEWVSTTAGKHKHGLFGLIFDHFLFIRRVREIILRENIDLIFANGTQSASIIQHAIYRKKIPLVIEYFEPHSRYMLENRIWNRWDPRFIYLSMREKKQRMSAWGLITVSENYHDQIRGLTGTRKVLGTAPCSVDHDLFRFKKSERNTYRKNIGIPDDCTVGIYTGKFGDLYWYKKAYELFQFCHTYFKGKFYLIILSPQNIRLVERELMEYDFDPAHIHVQHGIYLEIPGYLSAADFAFSLHRSNPSSIGYAPIKDGEYWASGLPVIITENIGDDSDIIIENNAGAVINENEGTWKKALDKIREIIEEPDHRNRIHELARKHRSIHKISAIYSHIFKEFEKG